MALMVRRILGAEPFDVGALPASSKVGPILFLFPRLFGPRPAQARPASTCSQGPRVTWPTSCLCFGSREDAPHEPWKPPCPTLPMFPPSGRKHAGPAYRGRLVLVHARRCCLAKPWTPLFVALRGPNRNVTSRPTFDSRKRP